MKQAQHLSDALEYLSDRTLEETQALRSAPRLRQRPRRWLAAAACLVLLLGLPLYAEATSGSVSNALAPLYGGAQTELVDGIGVPLGASVSAEGYILTADAIIGDRYSFSVVYTLRREDGWALPSHLSFDTWEHENGLSGSGSAILSIQPEGTQARVVETRKSSGSLLGRASTVTFGDLYGWEEGQEPQLLSSGPWTLKFTRRYQDTTVNVPVRNLKVSGSSGDTYTIQKLHLSPIGLHINLRSPAPADFLTPLATVQEDFTLGLRLKDGSLIPLPDRNIGGHHRETSDFMKLSITVQFETPIPLDQIAALVLCDTEYPVELD